MESERKSSEAEISGGATGGAGGDERRHDHEGSAPSPTTRAVLEEVTRAFYPYPSITNKVDDVMARCEGIEPDLDWVATPKAHGANLSFLVLRAAPEDIQVCRRNGVVAPDEDFHGVKRTMLPTLRPAILKLAASIFGRDGEAAAVQLFGEVFGGGDFATLKGEAGAIQREIKYSPFLQFRAFDVRVAPSKPPAGDDDGDDERGFLHWEDGMAACEAAGVPVVPIAFRGTRDEALRWATEHREDPVAATGLAVPGLPEIEGNIGEGYVIRPVRMMLNRYRNCVKVKSDHALQPSKAAKPKKCGPAKDPVSSAAGQAVRGLLSVHRVESVLAKAADGERTMKNVRVLGERVVRDAIDEYAEEDGAEDVSTITGSEEKALRGIACRVVASVLKSLR